jgi:hypothetical protein
MDAGGLWPFFGHGTPRLKVWRIRDWVYEAYNSETHVLEGRSFMMGLVCLTSWQEDQPKRKKKAWLLISEVVQLDGGVVPIFFARIFAGLRLFF